MGFGVNVLTETWKNKVRVFKLDGQLDSKTILELENAIKREQAQKDSAAWVMDLSKLSYVSSAGVAIFIGLGYEAEAKGGLCFYGANDKVHSVFDLLGLTEVFRFFPTEDEAKAQSGL
jgi:anti-sigma B factor antagonist